jgi:hypothetical protein
MHSIKVDDLGVISYINKDGALHPIASAFTSAEKPLKANGLLPQNYLYYGATIISNDCIELHFVILNVNRNDHKTWSINNMGQYQGQRDSSPSLSRGGKISHKLDFITNIDLFTATCRPFLNDLQIYFLLAHVLCLRSEARAFIDGLAPPGSQKHANVVENTGIENVHLLLVYNHCYARNIKPLDSLYAHRFAQIMHILPNVAPEHPRCMAVAFGSYQYHLAVIQGLLKIHQQVKPNDWVLVLQDDVLLHPEVNQSFLLESIMKEGACACYYFNPSINHNPSDNWPWNARIANSCYKQRDGTLGNGFEGPPIAFRDNEFTRGIGDVFALRADMIHSFVEMLGLYVSANTFPEVAIPTCLRLLRDSSCLPIGVFSGIYLWGEDRKKTGSDEWIKESFLNSSHMFIHPIKISRAVEILKLFGSPVSA